MRQTPCAATVVKKHPVVMSGGVGCESRIASTVFDVRRDQFAFRVATKVHDRLLVFAIEIVGIKGFLVEYQTNIIRALAFDVIGFADLFGNLCFGLAYHGPVENPVGIAAPLQGANPNANTIAKP